MSDAEGTLRIALAQINPTVGDFKANAAMIAEQLIAARQAGARIVALPELALCGYPPEDLLLKRHFLIRAADAVEELATASDEIVALVGYPELDGDRVFNATAVLSGGELVAVARKTILPNYGVFDERRYFAEGSEPSLVEVDGVTVGVTICEDDWHQGGPGGDLAAAGARLVINCSASPYHRAKWMEREGRIAERAAETGVPWALCNLVGGQDELVFDGHSHVIDAGGEVIARAGGFAPELLVCDVPIPERAASSTREPPGSSPARVIVSASHAPSSPAPIEAGRAEPLEEVEEVYRALVLGLRDYVVKNGFQHVVVALSGGVDSALAALLCTDAIGADGLTLVSMPSPYSSEGTRSDARAIAANLGSELLEIPIEGAMAAFDELLDGPFARGGTPGVAEENVQARIRGVVTMALSNRFGWLVVATGNKSEYSVGYATLYGDMAGGFAVIKDVPKTLVYELVRLRNAREGTELIPSSVLERPPSAELRPDQRDSDSLPPYDVLDRILEAYVESDMSAAEIAATGIDEATVQLVTGMVDRSEYKRRQAPPGVKITPKSFGRDRRLPITNRYRG